MVGLMRWGPLCLLLLSVFCRAAEKEGPRTFRLQMEAKPLAESITELCVAAQADCIYPKELKDLRHKANALKGEFTLEGALASLLPFEMQWES